MAPDEVKPFDVRATTSGGEEHVFQAATDGPVEQLVREFAERGLRVSEIRGRRARRLFEPRQMRLEDFAVFNAELAAACRRNVPLPEALRVLSRDMAGRRMRRAVEKVAAEVESGRDLGAALAAGGDAFPPAYVALVRAGLSSGNLAGTLLLFSEEARLADRVRRNTLSAVAYPLAMIFLASVIMALAGWVLLPVITGSLDSLNLGHLPALFECAKEWGPTFMRFAPVVLLVALAGGTLAWATISRRAGGAVFLGRLVLMVPLFGRFSRAVALLRFCRMLGGALALRTGVPEAVALAGLATGNAAAQAAAARAAAAIREGRPISEALRGAGRLFPATLVWMLTLGESRGDISGALEEFARLQEETADRLGRIIPTVMATAATLLAALVLLMSVIAIMVPALAALFSATPMMI